PRHPHSFPTRRSSDLTSSSAPTPSRAASALARSVGPRVDQPLRELRRPPCPPPTDSIAVGIADATLLNIAEIQLRHFPDVRPNADRKSTRLNSSHVSI